MTLGMFVLITSIVSKSCKTRLSIKNVLPVLNKAFIYFCRPDGEKKAYVRLASDYDALDVANKVCKVVSCRDFILMFGYI